MNCNAICETCGMYKVNLCFSIENSQCDVSPVDIKPIMHLS